MTFPVLLRWEWCSRPVALEPEGALAWGDAALRLHARVAEMSAERQTRLSVTANRDVLFVTGAVADLPWVDGVTYAARCPDALALWLPTTLQPDVPGDLLARALVRRHGRQPLLLWPEPVAVLPLDRLLPVSPAVLARVSAQWQAR